MLLSLLFLGALIFIFFVLRFVRPELIYSVRQVLVKIRTNKAFLDIDAKRKVVKTTFPQLLLKDLRYESLYYDERHVMRRLMKIRELYQMLDMQREDVPGISGERKPQVCLTELANLLENFANEIKPEIKYKYSKIVGANNLLLFIGNEIRRSNNESLLENEKQVEEWFTKNPISIEQTIEILIAAVFGLAYRQRTYGEQSNGVAGSILTPN